MKPEKHYLVRWNIDIFATSPEEAAAQALEIQRDPASLATVFEVRELHAKNFEVIDAEDLN